MFAVTAIIIVAFICIDRRNNSQFISKPIADEVLEDKVYLSGEKADKEVKNESNENGEQKEGICDIEKPMHNDELKKGIVIGNSITLGFGNHGMASSDVDTDYFYYVNQFLCMNNPEFVLKRIVGNGWENSTSSEQRKSFYENQIEPAIEEDVDLVIIQLGDNVSAGEEFATFPKDCIDLINRIKDKAPKARILWVFGRYHLTNLSSILDACNECEVEFVDVSIIASDKKYMASVGDTYIDKRGNKVVIENEGVASHPNDLGMKVIAEKILETLK